MSPFFRRDRGPLLALLALCAILYLPLCAARDFWEPDEPEFALLSRTMAERGDWVVPWQNGSWYAEKPPLLYWTVIAATGGGRAFEGEAGAAPFAARLPCALSAAALVLGLFLFARGPHGRRAAFLAAAVLATAGRVAWQAGFLQTDMPFTAAAAGAVMAFLAADRAPGPRPATGPLLLGWGLLGVSVLAKGPLGPVLAGISLLAHLLLGGGARLRRALAAPAHLAGLGLFAAIAVPWYLLVHARLGPGEGAEFLRQNLLQQNLGRTVSSYSHPQAPWFYLETLPLDLLPWTPVVVAGVAVLCRKAFRERDEGARTLLAWWIPGLLFLSAVSSKQGKYLLPLFPPLALAAGLWLDGPATEGARRPGPRWAFGLAAGVVAVAGVAALVAPFALPASLADHRDAASAAAPGGLLLLLGGGAALLRLLRGEDPPRACVELALAVAVGGAVLAGRVLPVVDRTKSARGFCDAVARAVPPGAEVAQFRSYRSAYPYYLRRVTPVVEGADPAPGEAPAGPGAADRRDAAALRAYLDRPARAWVIMQEEFARALPKDLRERLRPEEPAARAPVGGKTMVLLWER